jgi:hypothetical protein
VPEIPLPADQHHFDTACDDRPYCVIPSHHDVDAIAELAAAIQLGDDDEPQCNVDSAPGEVCYCTHREGCPFADGEDEPDDDAGYGDDWPPVVTEHAFEEAGLL